MVMLWFVPPAHTYVPVLYRRSMECAWELDALNELLIIYVGSIIFINLHADTSE